MGTNNNSQTNKKQVTQTELEKAVARVLNSVLPKVLNESVSKILEKTLSERFIGARPKTKSDMLMERKAYLIEEIAQIDVELDNLEMLGESSSPANTSNAFSSAYDVLTDARVEKTNSASQSQKSKVDSKLYESALARSRQAAMQRNASSSSGFETSIAENNNNNGNGNSIQGGQGNFDYNAILKNVMTAGAPAGGAISSQQNLKINQKLQEVASKVPMTEEERLYMQLMMDTTDVAPSAGTQMIL